jgi:hypothetical protein
MRVMSKFSEHHKNCSNIVRDCYCMTVPDVKKEFGVSEPTIRRWLSQEKAPTFFKVFGRVKTYKCWFKSWIDTTNDKTQMNSGLFTSPQREETSL